MRNSLVLTLVPSPSYVFALLFFLCMYTAVKAAKFHANFWGVRPYSLNRGYTNPHSAILDYVLYVLCMHVVVCSYILLFELAKQVYVHDIPVKKFQLSSTFIPKQQVAVQLQYFIAGVFLILCFDFCRYIKAHTSFYRAWKDTELTSNGVIGLE